MIINISKNIVEADVRHPEYVIDFSKITQAKYIKLGNGGHWEELCFKDGTMRLGFYNAPHEFGVKGEFEKLKQYYIGTEKKLKGRASDIAGQILDFYNAGPETLWVAFSKGKLWWTIATGPVEFLGHDKTKFPNGSRLRKTSGWFSTDLQGSELHKTNLSGHLTKVELYRGTICDLKSDALDYLIRKIKGEVMPEVEKVQAIKDQLLDAICPLIHRLTWRDFELLIDLIFTQGGWRRVNYTGGTEKTVDLELLQPMTGERAIVQIKSQTDQAQLEAYIEPLEQMQAQKAFYVYHTEKTALRNSSEKLALIGPEQLAEYVLNCGLLDWLMKKVG